jgi:hypothetical protein
LVFIQSLASHLGSESWISEILFIGGTIMEISRSSDRCRSNPAIAERTSAPSSCPKLAMTINGNHTSVKMALLVQIVQLARNRRENFRCISSMMFADTEFLSYFVPRTISQCSDTSKLLL